MKVCIIQPHYSTDSSKMEEYFNWEIEALDKCDESMDIIVMPESCDVPCLEKTQENFIAAVERYCPRMIEKAQKTAKRCNAMVFFNVSDEGYKNTTLAVDRQGNIVGRYDKQHPVWWEIVERGRESEYTFEFSEPYIIEIEGYRFAFLTCYDFYFYEMYENIARYNVDFVIGCSHQRSDTHEALETITKFLAYHTNAYVLRSSVSMDKDSPLGGCSMVVAPTGKILCNMKSEIGMTTVDIDPADKYYKPAGYGNPPAAHWEYIEKGRRPWKYRNAGAGIVAFDNWMTYPRLCAHRGFNTVAPENTMPAFGAAVAMGAQEIELDLWSTKDGALVTAHDPNLERVSNGTGYICEHTLEELKALDFGVSFGEKYAGLQIPTFEEILKQFAGRTVMNIHVKIWDERQNDGMVREIAELIKKYDCEKHVYFMSVNTERLLEMRALLPESGYCQGAERSNGEMIELAIKHGFDKVQLVGWFAFDKAMIDKCHENGIVVNFCQADKVNDAKWLLDMGVDCILTNDFHLVYEGVKSRLGKKHIFRKR